MWPVIRDVVRAADTFTYDPAMTEAEAREMWVEAPPALTVVALDGDRVLGTAKMSANRDGPGAHVATASFMVAQSARGRGVGSALCRFAVGWARERGFAGVQFNAVASSNEVALRVYERLGFRIVGTIPGAFEHPTLGRVGLHVLYLEL